jgi:hypothetical protein
MRRRGYRGLGRELARTGSKALWLQLRTGVQHILRRLFNANGSDGVELFLKYYGPDGFELPDASRRARSLEAERCLVCGRCSIECGRVGGQPKLDPEEAVVAASRLEIDWLKLGEARDPGASPCGACRACHTVCPVAIPIAEIQEDLAHLAPQFFARETAPRYSSVGNTVPDRVNRPPR